MVCFRTAQRFLHPDMRAVFLKIRFSESSIALLFIKGFCLLLGVQTDCASARVSDLGFSGGKDPGTQMFSAEFFLNGDPPDDIFSLCLSGEKPARGSGNLVYVQHKMNAFPSVSSNSSWNPCSSINTSFLILTASLCNV